VQKRERKKEKNKNLESEERGERGGWLF